MTKRNSNSRSLLDEDDFYSAQGDFDLEDALAPMPQSSAGVAVTSAGPPTESLTTKAASALLISASDKPGMAGIDRERINSILLRESGNSTFMQRQRKMDQNSNRKIEEMKRRVEHKDCTATNDWRREIEQSTTDPLLKSYRSQRRPTSTCVVIDMDGFFISCHTMLDPHLANIPACVGGTSMISTSNYAARKYGVRAAMPGYLGSALVRELSGGKETLTFVKSDFDLYKRKSAEVKAVLEEYDPYLKMHSLDEGYMDIGPYLELQLLDVEGELSHEEIGTKLLDKTRNKSTSQSAQNPIHETIPLLSIHTAAQSLLHFIRQKVKNITGLTCSAGLASNFLLAKIASDINKPNGQHFVGPSEQEILEFANPLPIRKISGIGRVMEKTLRGACDVEIVKDLYDKRAEVHLLFKPATAQFLMRASIGHAEGKRHESTEEECESDTEQEALHRKGISHERTFSPTDSWSDMCTRLEGIALSLAKDLRERNLRPKTITLKVKLANFDILSKAFTREVALFQSCNNRRSSRDLVDIVVNLLKEAKRYHERGGAPMKNTKVLSPGPNAGSPFLVRLLGVRCSNFQLEKVNQSSLYQYRNAGGFDDAGETPKAPGFPESQSNIIATAKNPYLSPKAMTLRGKIHGSKTKNSGNTNSNRTLFTSASPPPGPSPPPRPDPELKHVVIKMPLEAVKASSQIQCPICHRHFQTNKRDNAEINAHVDACLNAMTVKQLAKEETKCADERTKKKRRRLADFFIS